MAADVDRRGQVAAALATVRDRIADACAVAGRDPGSVTLVAVTKTYPAQDVVTLVELGVRDIGENRDQEARAKIAEVGELLGDSPGPRWHFVGQLQSRKARAVGGYAHAVHSVDRAELVLRLADGARRAARSTLEVFVQVSLDGDITRGGVMAAQLPRVADAVSAEDVLVLRGVMAVAPLGADPDRAFSDLAAASRQLQQHYPQASAISAGMTEDLEAAIRHGSTHVRVGSALLGRRDPAFG